MGTWTYAGNSSDKVVITRQDSAFMIVFANQAGAPRESLPGKVSGDKLVIDYDALGPHGAIIEALADKIGAHLSFAYRKSDDSLLLTGSNQTGSFNLVLRRSTLLWPAGSRCQPAGPGRMPVFFRRAGVHRGSLPTSRPIASIPALQAAAAHLGGLVHTGLVGVDLVAHAVLGGRRRGWASRCWRRAAAPARARRSY